VGRVEVRKSAGIRGDERGPGQGGMGSVTVKSKIGFLRRTQCVPVSEHTPRLYMACRSNNFIKLGSTKLHASWFRYSSLWGRASSRENICALNEGTNACIHGLIELLPGW